MARICVIISMTQICVTSIHQETLDPGDRTRLGVKSPGKTCTKYMQQYLRDGLIAPEIRKSCCAGSREFAFRVQLPAVAPICSSSINGESNTACGGEGAGSNPACCTSRFVHRLYLFFLRAGSPAHPYSSAQAVDIYPTLEEKMY